MYKSGRDEDETLKVIRSMRLSAVCAVEPRAMETWARDEPAVVTAANEEDWLLSFGVMVTVTPAALRSSNESV